MDNLESGKSPQAPRPTPALTKLVTAALLILSLLSTIVFVVPAAWSAFHLIDDFQNPGEGFEGNHVTIFVTAVAMIAGVPAVGSQLAGFRHLQVWTTPSAKAAQAAAWIGFGLLLLPFALVWKEIHSGGHLGDNSILIEAFVIIATVVHFAYTLILYETIAD